MDISQMRIQRRARAPWFKIIKSILCLIIILNLMKKQLLREEFVSFRGLCPLDPHHGFTLDPLGDLRQPFYPPSCYRALPF